LPQSKLERLGIENKLRDLIVFIIRLTTKIESASGYGKMKFGLRVIRLP